MYTHTSPELNTFNNQNVFFKDISFTFDNLQLTGEEDYSILEAELLEVKDSPIRVRKEVNEPSISSKKSPNKFSETILEIIKTISGSFVEKTESNAKEGVRLSNLFIYRNFWSVKNYLNENLQLRDLLFETYYKLKEHFGNRAQFILELIPDIYEPEFEQLFIRVILKQDFKQGLEILDSFEKEWWFERTGYFLNSPVIALE